jgi:hypothetical protein
MVLPVGALQSFPAELLQNTGLKLHPILPDESTQKVLAQYREAKSDQEREEIEKQLVCASCFHHNVEAFDAFFKIRNELTHKIANIQKRLQGAVSPVVVKKLSDVEQQLSEFKLEPVLEKELRDLEQQLSEFESEVVKMMWMTNREMQLHRDAEASGFPLPPLWKHLVSLVRKEYCLMADVVYSSVQGAARTIGGVDEFRIDVLPHTICLLKYYGFICADGSIIHPLQLNLGIRITRFVYNLMNPTWQHLENEIRNDAKSIDLSEEQLPPLYPDTPLVAPSPLKTPQTRENAILVASMCSGMSKEERKKYPLF